MPLPKTFKLKSLKDTNKQDLLGTELGTEFWLL